MMLLQNKTAIVYGAAGRIGSAVSMAFAREGATVCITGRRKAPLEYLACKIEQAGGKAVMAIVDALDEDQVMQHAANVSRQFGSVDISFNAIGADSCTGKPVTEQSLYEFEEPALKLIRSHFITATTMARLICTQGAGTVIILTASEERCLQMYKGGYLTAYKGLEAFCVQFARELQSSGGKLVCLRYPNTPKQLMLAADNKHSYQLDKLATVVRMQNIPFRTTDAEDIASLAARLAAEKIKSASAIIAVAPGF